MSTRTHPKSPYHFIVVRRPDGTQVNVSTKTRNSTVANLMEGHARLRLAGDAINPMTMNEALEIADGICKAANMKNRTPILAIEYLRGLLKEHTGSEIYLRQKSRTVDVLEEVLLVRGRSKINIWDISGDDVGKFQAHFVALGRRDYTIRVYTHVLSALLAIAVKRNVISENVVEQVNKPPRPKNSPRRPFTDDELNAVFLVADNEWRGMILVALYTGLRLGDVSRLVYRDIDMVTSHIRAAVKKAHEFEAKPIAKALKKYLLTLQWPIDLDTPLFPRAYRWAMSGCKSLGPACRAFTVLLIKAGVRKKGESCHTYKREGGEKYAPLSFHCLRHNCSTMLKLTQVPEAIARKIMGHRSVVISDIYTHLGEDIMLAAVQNVPNVIDSSCREIGTSFAA